MKSRGRSREISTDLTPLIDVVFLLLIFFMVSSVFKKDQYTLGLSLPKSESGKKEERKNQEKFIIEMASSGEIAYNGKKISRGELESQLRVLEKTAIIELRADKEVTYEKLVNILDLLQQSQLTHISLVTDKES